MLAFVAVFYGENPESAALIGLAYEPEVIAIAAEAAARSPHYGKQSKGHPALEDMHEGRKNALLRIAAAARKGAN